MRIGSVYKLNTPTLAIMIQNGSRVAVSLPANSALTILGTDGPMVDVEWDGKPVTMFAVDLQTRG